MPIATIENASHIVLAVRKEPDADVLGAACAVYSHLLRLNKKITLYCETNIAEYLSFLPWYEKATCRFPKNGDCIVGFGSGDALRLGITEGTVAICFEDRFGNGTLADTEPMGTAMAVFDFFVANGIKINAKMATSLYAGLVETSQCFRSKRCRARDFEAARTLLSAGADHALCVEWLFEHLSLAFIRSRGVLFRKMRLLLDGQLAVFDVDGALLEETGASISECETVSIEALRLRTVRAALIHSEEANGRIRLLLRTDDTLDASKIMGDSESGDSQLAYAYAGAGELSALKEKIITDIQKEMG